MARSLRPSPRRVAFHSTVVLALLLCCGCQQFSRKQGRREAFTIVMLPDTQIYSKSHPELFHAQTNWIKSQAASENIVFVTQVGDIVNERNKSPAQWAVASAAMATLDHVVPYGVAIGNHDYDGEEEDKTRATCFLENFGPQRYAGRPWYGGASPNGLNSFQLISAGGLDLVFLHLEADVPDTAIAWAEGVLREHPTRAAIVSTHIYLRGREGVTRNKKYGYNKAGNSAEEVWDKLIRRNAQIFMVLCGHEGRTDEYYQVERNDAGHAVLEMLADYQKRPRGGEGYLRLIRIDPTDLKIQVRTYSPALDRFETDANSQFTVALDLPSTTR